MKNLFAPLSLIVFLFCAGNAACGQQIPGFGAQVPTTAPGASSVTCGTGLSGGTITTSGTCAVNLTTASNTLGADVSLTSTTTYFDGPSMAQGTSGTWLACGTVTLQDTAGIASYNIKLWDGTTVVSSEAITQAAANQRVAPTLCGIIANPAGNIRLSVEDASSTSGFIRFNITGLSKDSSIWGVRIQ